MRKLLRDALLYFLFIGVCLSSVSGLLNEENSQVDAQTIVVDREDLLRLGIVLDDREDGVALPGINPVSLSVGTKKGRW